VRVRRVPPARRCRPRSGGGAGGMSPQYTLSLRWVVVPVDPFGGGQLDGVHVAPRSSAPDDLILQQPDDGLGQGLVAAGAHRQRCQSRRDRNRSTVNRARRPWTVTPRPRCGSRPDAGLRAHGTAGWHVSSTVQPSARAVASRALRRSAVWSSAARTAPMRARIRHARTAVGGHAADGPCGRGLGSSVSGRLSPWLEPWRRSVVSPR
jgi:hypothetical protein